MKYYHNLHKGLVDITLVCVCPAAYKKNAYILSVVNEWMVSGDWMATLARPFLAVGSGFDPNSIVAVHLTLL